MTQKNAPPPIVFILIFFALIGSGYWYFFNRQSAPSKVAFSINTPSTSFSSPSSLPSGTTVRIDGSTSMVTINQNLKRTFERQFPGTNVVTSANGSQNGIADLLAGRTDIAAVSRPLTAQEQSQGLVAVAITTDAIALVVGKANPFNGGLTSAQAADIFQGKTNNWSAVGGNNGTIRVINRPAISGTHQAFKEMVLKGVSFGTTPNITTLQRDATTPLLQALGTDGIGYATFAQVANQQTVRVIPIDGLTPDASGYPFQRQLYYVYKNPPNLGVQAFLGYATSAQGQQAMILNN
ncbi:MULTISPECIES: phosphate ABC transporter substrate-binding protein [Nostoc]|uniref:Phosphate ABC transporter substrate-binding protein n=1 Tax=Nostoc paludosum FACHB-159 TaxID=2692908 RepID=A0ABR8K5Y7_9NOSO|nr:MULTISPECIES: phosphate ABC transporter substrate-binding protein [Nostoc]MBD2678804.1 phosphate ABC transporter substrate-binding protein [Nostoc sp. FACHB-857]MBD2734855.1 phosphate ABC transporter substrate-binding protein [Nostoc paludosum FACHB-159]